ncbi:MAG: cupin domain-containing protein [Armatimonadota bacterium]
MPVLKHAEWHKKPGWCSFSDYGICRMSAGEFEPDYHFHDCDEYFFVIDGRAVVRLECQDYEIGEGDAVLIPMEAGHQILEIKEDLTILWIYDELKGLKRTGHVTFESVAK